ncbi:MAG: energy transducer TonB, partial [Bacteroidetes Order II. Incertae sedis bacterium]|nr:energy transducer TonB [Bacteroidetes Order II. bacterium]
MKKEDWTGVSISLGVHVVIILLLSFLTVAASEETPIGFMEVEFGPIADG